VNGRLAVGASRKFLQTKAGRAIAIVLAVGSLALMVFVLRDTFRGGYAGAAARDRMFICAQTGKTFRHEIRLGETLPVESPYSGQKTGYPAEPCFWTKDGGTKPQPTWVLLDQYAGKSGPTFCPDCGRLVTPLNQGPQPGVQPPPTKDQYKSAREKR
jgi:hypothetical protein